MSTIRVYQYGLLPPTENARLVDEQMRAAHRYRNTLVEIERGRRAAVRAVLGDVDAHLRDLAAEHEVVDRVVEEAAREVKAARAGTRSRSETEAMRGRLRDARSRKSETARRLREHRRDVRAALVDGDAMSAIAERAGELRRSARAHCGVYWGTYLLVEDADTKARDERTSPLYNAAAPNDPHFVRWSAEGRVGVQIQHGIAIENVLGGTDSRVRIGHLPAAAWEGSRKERRTTLAIRVGTVEGKRDPVWAVFPMVMHRPIPPGSIIKWAVVSLRRSGVGPVAHGASGARSRWTVELTVEVPDAARRPATASAGSAVGIDVGWRQFADDGVRVAAWADEAGRRGELRVDEAVMSAIEKADELRSIRDKNFDAARDALAMWIDTQRQRAALQGATSNECGIELLKRTCFLAAWRSPGRLAAFAHWWRDHRIDGDEVAYRDLEAWRYHDHHLWDWENHQRAKALRRRREGYRLFAADLAARYETVVLEHFDLRTFARRAPVEAAPENETARTNRQRVAVGELRLAIENAFRGRGGTVAHRPAHWTTKDCAACGHRNAFDAAANLNHACYGCGVVWDQDDNAADNLLIRLREQPGGGEPPGVARKRRKGSENAPEDETRWQRAARMRAEKMARKETAREPGRNAAE